MRSNIRRKKSPLKLILITAVALIVALVVGIRIIPHVLVPTKTGVLIYDDSLSESEKNLIAEVVSEDERFSKDLIASAKDSQSRPTDNDHEVLADILLPVVDFYSPFSDISSEKLLNATNSDEIELISLNNLDSSKKLLSVDNKYFLDDFDGGALFRTLSVETTDGNTDDEAQALVARISEHFPKFISKDDVLSINQTGVTALARAMQTKLNQVGDAGYFAEKIADFLSATDLTHISNEVSFADSCTTSSGSTTLCADPRMIKAIEAIGTDIVELTGNHNNDWSAKANLSSLALYEEKGYKTFGGGKDEETAKIPLKLDEKNTKITWIGVNQSTSTKANGQGALGSHPGANIYDEKTVKEQIESAKKDGDFVIVDVQFFECYSYPAKGTEMPSCDAPISGQQSFFRHLIDLGADMVVGTQAHQPQTYEIYSGRPIYYGLGNLFFDQVYWPGTERGIILTHYFLNGKLLQTRISPTIYDTALQVQLMDKSSAEQFLTRILKSSPRGK